MSHYAGMLPVIFHLGFNALSCKWTSADCFQLHKASVAYSAHMFMLRNQKEFLPFFLPALQSQRELPNAILSPHFCLPALYKAPLEQSLGFILSLSRPPGFHLTPPTTFFPFLPFQRGRVVAKDVLENPAPSKSQGQTS